MNIRFLAPAILWGGAADAAQAYFERSTQGLLYAGSGAVAVGGMLFVGSGYAVGSAATAGNVLLAFAVP